MKIYKYITITLLAALCLVCGYESFQSLSIDSHMYFVLTVCCLVFVIFNGEKKTKKGKKARNAKV